MVLIQCPDCNKEISPRADFCPYCGCPSDFFDIVAQATDANKYQPQEIDFASPSQSRTQKDRPLVLTDLTAPSQSGTQKDRPPVFTVLTQKDRPPVFQKDRPPVLTQKDRPPVFFIEFEQEHRSLFSPAHYITQREIKQLHTKFDLIAQQLNSKQFSLKELDAAATVAFLQKHGTLDDDALAHNNAYVHRKVAENKEYFDNIFAKIDRDIMLDTEQRHAIVTDDDYVLLVAGAGTGKTTTMAAKVKYLVEKCGVNPNDIIAISYTNKAIGELRDRINRKFKIPARINTFHAFAYDVVRQHSKKPPAVSYSSYRYIYEMLEKAAFNNAELVRNLVLYLGYYFDLTENIFKFDDINKYHMFKAQQEYETIKSILGEYSQKVRDNRKQSKTTCIITGEFLRSAQEVQIANFLYLNGFDYEYEPKYPYQVRGSRKIYTPDFVIRQGDKTAYLEHYALSESGSNAMFTGEQITKYKQGIQIKRNLHKHNGTMLLETWSSYSDMQPLLSHLRGTLTKAGFKPRARNLTQIYKKLLVTGKEKYIYKLLIFMRIFISQYKTLGYDTGGFAALRVRTDDPRTLLFLDIAEDVYTYYQEQLRSNNLIDLEDMIHDANFYLGEFERQGVTLPFKYIIIDEFQDIARQRFNLTKRLSEITQAKVVAVGDDWQSIYAFAGSDITLFTRFLQLMGSGTEMKITRTYRNPQELIDIAGAFIQKNSPQIHKRLISSKTVSDPIVLEEFDDSAKTFVNLARAVENIIGKLLEEFGDKQKILLLGRYAFDGFKLTNTKLFQQLSKNGEAVRCAKYPKAKLTFMTSRSSKGLGFDNVIILNMFEGKYGFPSQIENDPIMKLVTYEDNSAPYAEERRLFYVALTRTKNRVYLVAPQNKPSRFLVELVHDYKLAHSEKLNMSLIDVFPRRCPICGFPLKFEFNKTYGLSLYSCTNEAEICDFKTNHPKFLHDIYKCDNGNCSGYMIVKTNEEKPYYGCTNQTAAKNCRNTQTIE